MIKYNYSQLETTILQFKEMLHLSLTLLQISPLVFYNELYRILSF